MIMKIWRIIRSLVLFVVVVLVFCCIDLSAYSQWVEARKMLTVLRSNPRNDDVVAVIIKNDPATLCM